MNNKRKKLIKYRQKMINEKYACIAVINLFIIFVVLTVSLVVRASEKNKNEGEDKTVVYESNIDVHSAIASPANTPSATIVLPEPTEKPYCRNFTEDEKLLLAKIAMAEAEGESIETKMYVILTVLNRVESSELYFPDTIEEVIFQSKEGVYQFSPVMPGGRYWTTEPSSECWEAVEIVNTTENDISQGALYFETCKNADNWHSRNLEFLFESDGMRFYKNKMN